MIQRLDVIVAKSVHSFRRGILENLYEKMFRYYYLSCPATQKLAVSLQSEPGNVPGTWTE